ncbi:MAG: DNA polymerase III subunit beta [Bacilli bacterium]|nr:DNA polymerase III subunit beta [Bacilli bacterium]MDY6392313.1 DNA polymerase III subunit beta [Bacilli bacterium]
MRLSIDKEQFLKALNVTSKAIANKSADPLLANLKLDLNDRGLEVTGTNKEITIQCLVPYRIGEREIIRSAGLGAALINAKLLTEVVRRMDGTELALEVIDDSIAKIDDGRSSFKLNCIKAEAFTDIDLEPNGTILSLGCDEFASLVEQSAFAASTKEQRPILTALNLEANEGILTATATDSARLARKTISIDSDAKFRCNIPAKVCADVTHLFEGSKRLTLAVSDTSVLFLFDNVIVCSRLISGDYPVTRAIIPQTFNYYLEVNAQELLAAMSRASLLSAERDYVVKLSMAEDEVQVSARSEQSGSALESIQTFQFTGERLDVSFNSLFVIDAIKALKAEDVRVCFQAEMKPFVVLNPKDDSVIELITPMRTY